MLRWFWPIFEGSREHRPPLTEPLYSKIFSRPDSILADSNPIFIIQCIGNNAIEIRGHALVALIFQSHDDRGFVH